MAVCLRLQRFGRPNRAYYRIVATNKRTKRNSESIEILGHYDPCADDNNKVKIKKERVEYWLKQGAETSDTVRNLLKKALKLDTLNKDTLSQ